MLELNGEEIYSATESEYQLETALDPAQTHQWRVFAEGDFDRYPSETWEFTIDPNAILAPPVLYLTSCIAQSNGTLNLTGQAEDNNEVTSIQYVLDDNTDYAELVIIEPNKMISFDTSLNGIEKGQHRVQLRAIDNDGNSSEIVPIWFFIDPRQGVPILVIENFHIYSDNSIELGGYAMDLDGTIQAVQVSLDGGDPENLDITKSVETSFGYHQEDMLDGPHTLEFTATDDDGNTVGPLTLNFYIGAITSDLPTPIPLYPDYGDIICLGEFDFSWTNFGNPLLSYEVHLSTSSLFVSDIIEYDNLTNPSVASGDLVENANYYWRVRTKENTNLGMWSTPYTFYYDPIATPTSLEPTGTGCYVNPEFSWTTTGFNHQYTIEYSTDSTFQTGVKQGTSRMVGYYQPLDPLIDGMEYFWRVKSNDWECTSEWATASFVVSSTIAPITVTGVTGLPCTNPPTITWSGGTNADTFQVEVSSTRFFENDLPGYPVTGIPGTQMDYTLAEPLSSGSYWVRIKGVETGCTVLSASSSFTIPENAITAGWVTDACTTGLDAILSWSATGTWAPATFDLYYDTDSDPSDGSSITGITSNYPLSGLTNGTDYFWYIEGSDGTCTYQSDIFKFTTGTPPVGEDAYETGVGDNEMGLATIVDTQGGTQCHTLYHEPTTYDHDWFSFDAEEGKGYEVRVSQIGSHFDGCCGGPVWGIVNQFGTEFYTKGGIWGGSRSLTRYTFCAEYTGAHYIHMRQVEKTISTTDVEYTIAVVQSKEDPYESDNTPEQAVGIMLDGTPQTHTFHCSGDVDYIKFPIQPMHSYTLSITERGSQLQQCCDSLGIHITNEFGGTVFYQTGIWSGGVKTYTICNIGTDTEGIANMKLWSPDGRSGPADAFYTLSIVENEPESFEPDNSEAFANELEMTTSCTTNFDCITFPTAPETHKLDCKGDEDWYTFEVTAPKTLQIELTNIESGLRDCCNSLAYTIYDMYGNVLFSRDGMWSSATQYYSFCNEDFSGPVTLRIYSPEGRGGPTNTHYDLGVYLLDYELYEPDNSAAESYDLGTFTASVNEEKKWSNDHYFACAYDEDWFSVDLNDLQCYKINLKNMGAALTAATNPLTMTIYAADLSELLVLNGFWGSANYSYFWCNEYQGTAYIKLRPNGTGVRTENSHYDLELVQYNIASDEYNDTLSDATPLILNDPALTRSFECKYDQDFYSVPVTNGTSYSIYLTNLGSELTGILDELRYTLFDDSFIQLGSGACDVTDCPVIPFNATYDGNLIIKLRDKDGNGRDSGYGYDIQVTQP